MHSIEVLCRTHNPFHIQLKACFSNLLDNPCPQQGHIVNIRLSEKIEPVRLADNSVREMISETFFQMNYQTGEWRRIKKFKEPARGVGQMMSQVISQ